MAEVAELQTGTIDCAWCGSVFGDVVDLLDHVDTEHIGSPEPDLHAAA